MDTLCDHMEMLWLCSYQTGTMVFSLYTQVGHLTTFYVGHNLELLFDSWQINTVEGKRHLPN